MTVPKLITDCFTERDGVSWCPVRIFAVPILMEMSYKFLVSIHPDFQSFGLGITAVLTTIAFKNLSEKGN